MNTRVVVDISVITYNRPEGLLRLLESVMALNTSAELTYTINIVDNDRLGSARRTVSEFARRGIMVRYAIEPTPNISLARNRSLSMGQGDFVAILDDDEIAEPNWLINYFECYKKYGFDVLFGPVRYRFDSKIIPWVQKAHIRKHLKLSHGSTSGFIYRTANCFFRRGILDLVQTWFNPDFGCSGGEDAEFFGRISRSGVRLGWCADAITEEFVPKSRATVSWMTGRKIRQGMNASRVERLKLQRASYFREILSRQVSMVSCLLKLPVGILCAKPFKTVEQVWQFFYDLGFLVNAHFKFYLRSYR